MRQLHEAPAVYCADRLKDAVRAGILGAQQGRVLYPEFKRLSQRASCIGYTVWIIGRHVAYLGRRGETHVERFPSRLRVHRESSQRADNSVSSSSS